MNLTEKTAESAEGAGALDGAEAGATLDVVEAKASVATPAATAGGVTLDQLQQLLSHQAASTALMMREMQTNMQNQISEAIERIEDRPCSDFCLAWSIRRAVLYLDQWLTRLNQLAVSLANLADPAKLARLGCMRPAN